MISALTRLSYSPIILVLEASNSFDLTIPMVISVFTCNFVSNYFTTSLLQRELRGKNVPFLTGRTADIPEDEEEIRAFELMSDGLISIKSVSEIWVVQRALKSSHNGFPVLNSAGNLVGLCPRNVLDTLCQKEAFYHLPEGVSSESKIVSAI